MRVLQRRRHELRGLVAGVTEHDPLVAGSLVLVANSIDPARDIRRLRMDVRNNFEVFPVKAALFVSDIPHRVSGDLLQTIVAKGVWAAHLPRRGPQARRPRIGTGAVA